MSKNELPNMKTDFAKIELLVLDVDGVLTDGKIILSPTGQETKEFHARDGSGMKYWRRLGGKIAIISGRGSRAIAKRAKELGIDAIRVNAKDKLPAYASVLAELKIPADRAAVIGDDLPDLPLLQNCAFPVAVADAVSEVKKAAAYVTQTPGGWGAVRETIERILKGARRWDQVLQRYQNRKLP